MENTKLYNILEYFDKYEHNRLYKYLNSPYFNKHEAIINLYELLRKNLFSKLPKPLDKEKLWKKIYKDQPYDDVKFRKLVSDLLKLVEGFLAQEVYQENPLHQATYLLEAVKRKKMEKLYNTAITAANRLSTKQNFRTASYYFYRYQIEKSFYDLKQGISFKRDERGNLEEIINNLDWFYLAEKLKYYCDIQSQKTVVSHEYKLLFIDEIIEHLKKFHNAYEGIPLISLYYHIYLTQVETENEDHYFTLKSLIEQHIEELPKEDANYIYNYALNYSIRKVNQGKRKFLREYYDTFQQSLDNELIFETGGVLSPWHFRNSIFSALRLEEYDWVENFINQYGEKLPEGMRENAISFNLSMLYFYQKKYDKVIELLREVEYDDYSYNLVSKSMLIATYYEIDEYDPLDSLLESFRAYLNRHKNLPQSRRDLYMNLIKFTKKLSRIRPGDKEELKKLKAEIDNTKGIASEKWLREKIAELE